MTLQTRNTVMALVKETTEGTPVSPSAATDFIALQDGFSLEPAFDEIDNEELTGSIGNAKPILGLENPSASLSHYMRHSGVEGTAPSFDELIEGFMGEKVAKTVERVSDAGSTTATVVTTVADTEYEAGMALLVKDGTNGYSVRNVDNVFGVSVGLAQDLAVAPASGVSLGLPILYKPSDQAHPTISVWNYRGNATAGALELMAGGRVTEMSIEATAGELINGSFTLEGNEFFYDPIEITASTNAIDFDDGGGEENVTVTAQTYKDPYELASAIETAMEAATADDITVSYDDTTGKYTIATAGGTLSLLWNTGTNTATTIGAKIGFDTAADDTASTSYEADSVIDKSAAFTPDFDDEDPLVAKNNEVLLGLSDDITCFEAQSVTINGTNTKTDVLSVCAVSGKSGSQFTEREISVDIVATLQDHQAKEFQRFREGTTLQFTYTTGRKTGGNWVAGSVVNYFSNSTRISSFQLDDNDGIVTLNMTLTCFVEDGAGEFYVNML